MRERPRSLLFVSIVVLPCALLAAFGTRAADDRNYTATIRGQKVTMSVPAGMVTYSPTRAMARPDLAVPDANEVIAIFMPAGSAEYEEPYYMMVQALRKDIVVSAEELAKVAESMAAAGGAREDLLKRARESLKEKTPLLQRELRDNSAKLVPLALITRGYLMRSESIQALNTTGVASVTARGVESIVSRPSHMAIVRIRPNKIVFVYFFGEITEAPDSKKYESMLRNWLLDFDKRNNGTK